ncbi:MAG: MCP four helix bundle domain-containing protein [Oscillospiraceae bacterium]|nr:MCP four helix bundle domain-containing protein [Oscillospiraceae bacterium]
MKNMKISRKLLISFGIILLYLMAMIAFAVVSVNNVSGKLDVFYDEPYHKVQEATQLNLKLNEIAKYMLFAAVTPEEEDTKAKIELAEDILKEMKVLIEDFKLTYTGDMADIEQLESDRTGLLSVVEAYRKIAQKNDIENSYLVYCNQIVPRLDKALVCTENIIAHEEAIADEIHLSSKQQAQSTLIILVIIGAIAVTTGIGLAVYITRLITKGIDEVEFAADKMSDGDFNVNITYESRDEIGKLADSMRNLQVRTKNVVSDIDYLFGELAEGNLGVRTQHEDYYVGVFRKILLSLRSFVTTLSRTIAQINLASDQVASDSDRVSMGAQSLSQGASDQASSIEELSATISVISDMISGNANDAGDASEKTRVAVESLNGATEKMNELVESMNEISMSSDQVRKIIKTIDDIAFQTNILALNAAVEAARAGAAGKGFAVVADEVRNLAGKSAEAAHTTTQLIEDTVEAIERGSVLVDEVAQQMNFAAESSDAVSEINVKIAESAKSAAEAVYQVTAGVDQISSVVQTNTATAEESASASEELSGQSHMLKELIGQFTLREETEISDCDTADEEIEDYIDFVEE